MPLANKNFVILFDCHTFDVGWQGTSTYLAGVINALPKVISERLPNIDLKIVCAASDKRAVERFVDIEFVFEPIPTRFFARNVWGIPRAARRQKADLIVSQYVRPFYSTCPTLSVIHDVLFLDYADSFSWKYRVSRKVLFGWSARKSTFVSAVSQYSAERIAHHLNVDREAILVIANAVDPEFANAKRFRKTEDRVLRMLSVSRLERRKRHEWGIEALKVLASRGIAASYTIIGGGDGVYAQELRNSVDAVRAELGLDITLKSDLDFPALIQEYADADVFLCPSLAEGFGIPVIEAAAAGTPCVSTNGGALAELEWQFRGYMVSAEDRAGFVNAVCVLANEIETHRIAAQDVRARVSEIYSWDRAAHVYVDVIQNLIRHSSSGVSPSIKIA